MTRSELYQRIWETGSVAAVARSVGVSATAVRKRCILLHIPFPGRGYIQKRDNHRAVQAPPPLPPEADVEITFERGRYNRPQAGQREGSEPAVDGALPGSSSSGRGDEQASGAGVSGPGSGAKAHTDRDVTALDATRHSSSELTLGLALLELDAQRRQAHLLREQLLLEALAGLLGETPQLQPETLGAWYGELQALVHRRAPDLELSNWIRRWFATRRAGQE